MKSVLVAIPIVLRDMRIESGMDQAELARRLPYGITDKAISTYETGRTVPSLEIIEAIARLFGRTLTEFFAAVERTARALHAISEQREARVARSSQR